MLQRVGPDLFQASAFDSIRILAIAQNNGGVEAALFRYGTTQLPAEQIQGHPGCSFVVAVATTMFGCVVVFSPGGPAGRYDLFEVLPNGTLSDLQVSATPGFGGLVQFRIRSVAAAVVPPLVPRRRKVRPKRRVVATTTKRPRSRKKRSTRKPRPAKRSKGASRKRGRR